MSRSPTDFRQFWQPQTPIQPAAQPTNQFVQPGIKEKGGGDFLDFARQMSQLEPKLAPVVDALSNANQVNQQTVAEAQFEANKARYQNVQGFRGAVDSGQLAESNNPWYVRRTEQLFGMDAAHQAVNAAQLKWQQDGTFRNGPNADNPQAINQYFSQQLQPVTQGMDNYTAASAAPILQNGMQQLIQQHSAYRVQAREQEHANAFAANVATAMQPIDKATMDSYNAGDPQAIATVNQARSNLQALQSSELSYTDPQTVKDWVKQGVGNAATDRLDGRIAQEFYTNLKRSDGSPLDPTDSAKAWQRDLSRTITDRQIQQNLLQSENQRAMDDKSIRQGSQTVLGMLTDLQKTNPRATFADIDKGQLMQKLAQNGDSATVVFDVLGHLANEASLQQGLTITQRQQKMQDFLSEQTDKFLSNKLGQDGDKVFYTTLAKLGGAEQARELATVRNALMRDGPEVSNPDVLVDFNQKWMNGNLNADDVNKAFQHQALTKQDYYTFTERLWRDQEQGGPLGSGSRAMLQNLTGQLDDQIATGFTNTARQNGSLPAQPTVGMPAGEGLPRSYQVDYVKQSGTYRQSVNDAQRQLADIISDKSKDAEFRKLSPPQQRDELQNYVDDISDAHGGFTKDQHDTWLQGEMVQQQQQAVSKAPDDNSRVVLQKIDKAPSPPINRIGNAGTDLILPKDLAATSEAVAQLLDQKLPDQRGSLPYFDPLHNGRIIGPLKHNDLIDPTQEQVNDPLFRLAYSRVALNPATQQPSVWTLGNSEFHRVTNALGHPTFLLSSSGVESHDADEIRTAIKGEMPGLVQQVQDHARLLGSQIQAMKVPQKLNTLYSKIQLEGGTPQELDTLNWCQQTLAKYAVARQYAGYGEKDWPTLDKQAWQNLPLFQDYDDLKSNGSAAMKVFGLNPNDEKEISSFQAAQVKAIAKLNDVRLR